MSERRSFILDVGSGLIVEVSVETGTMTPLRGELAVSRKTDLMELVQDAQFRASAAAAGCSIAKPVPDDGMDWVVFHKHQSHVYYREVAVEVQLKSTASIISPPAADQISFPVDSDTFNRLTEPSSWPRLLIVCLLPKELKDWVLADQLEDVFKLRHLSYWCSLRGMTPTGATQTTIHIPTLQVFDDVALCDIMRRIGRGEDL